MVVNTKEMANLRGLLYYRQLEESQMLVPGAGLEPAWSYLRGILSPLRLPVSPPGRDDSSQIAVRR